MQERGTVETLRRTGRRRSAVWVTLATAAVVVLLDQLTKAWALSALAHRSIHVVGPLSLTLRRNTGSAFSLFTGSSPVLAVIAGVLAVGMVVVATRVRSRVLAGALGLVLGGALGNLADRVFRSASGGVVDFIDLRFWPTFNLADSAIVVGIVAIVVIVLVGERRQAQGPPGGASP